MFKKYFWKIRTLQILAIILFSSIIIYQFVSLQNESNTVRFEQTDKFSYSLTNLAAAEASRYLSQKNPKELQLLIDSLSNDPVIRDATIYDQFGKIIYQSEKALPLTTLLKINGENEEAKGVIPYIAELQLKKKKIGYIRITLEQQKILSLIHDYEKRGLAILELLVVLSFITGMILMAVFFRRFEVIYKDLKSKAPFILQRIKKEIQKLIKIASK